jgi:hypothetical protein
MMYSGSRRFRVLTQQKQPLSQQSYMQVKGVQTSAPASNSVNWRYLTFMVVSDCSSAEVFLGVSCPRQRFAPPCCSFLSLTAWSACKFSCRISFTFILTDSVSATEILHADAFHCPMHLLHMVVSMCCRMTPWNVAVTDGIEPCVDKKLKYQ